MLECSLQSLPFLLHPLIFCKFGKAYPFPVFQFQHELHLISSELKGTQPRCCHLIFQNTEVASPKSTKYFITVLQVFRHRCLRIPIAPSLLDISSKSLSTKKQKKRTLSFTSSQVGTLFSFSFILSQSGDSVFHARLSKICSSMWLRCFTTSLQRPSSALIRISITCNVSNQIFIMDKDQ